MPTLSRSKRRRGGLRRSAGVIGLLGALLVALVAASCAPVPPTAASTISFRYSHFEPRTLTATVGVPVTITLKNDDPIEHEWIVGTAEVHEVHRYGTEAYHEGRPTEVTVPPFASRTTTVTFDRPGVYEFICHLPGHEAYGMKGVLRVV
jgi:uncharacterized cupredoxin-like copper-binding protein